MKRFFPLALALMMVLSLTACGGMGGGKSRELTAQHGAKVRVDIGYTTPGYNGSGAATAVGLSLLQYQLQTEDEALVSPLSALYALGMTMNGAAGNTLEQMETALYGNMADWNTFLYYLRDLQCSHAVF